MMPPSIVRSAGKPDGFMQVKVIWARAVCLGRVVQASRYLEVLYGPRRGA
jgi:hypothetical protein